MLNKLTLCHGVGFSGRICAKRDTCRRFLLLQSDNNTLIPRQQSTFMCNLDHLYYINHYCNDGDDIIIDTIKSTNIILHKRKDLIFKPFFNKNDNLFYVKDNVLGLNIKSKSRDYLIRNIKRNIFDMWFYYVKNNNRLDNTFKYVLMEYFAEIEQVDFKAEKIKKRVIRRK